MMQVTGSLTVQEVSPSCGSQPLQDILPTKLFCYCGQMVAWNVSPFLTTKPCRQSEQYCETGFEGVEPLRAIANSAHSTIASLPVDIILLIIISKKLQRRIRHSSRPKSSHYLQPSHQNRANSATPSSQLPVFRPIFLGRSAFFHMAGRQHSSPIFAYHQIDLYNRVGALLSVIVKKYMIQIYPLLQYSSYQAYLILHCVDFKSMLNLRLVFTQNDPGEIDQHILFCENQTLE